MDLPLRRAPRTAGLAIALLLAALLAGCAAPQTRSLQERGRSPLGYQLLHVPFHPQEDHACGPAALATVLGASGADASPDGLAREVYLPGREGSLAPELLAAARRHGRFAVEIPPTLDALLAEIDAGHPVLVLLNLGLNVFPVWHYAVVTGYDLPRSELHLHSGRQADAVFALSTFERTWMRGGGFAMVVAPAGELPATASFDRMLEAAAALERLDPRAALPAWQALAAREPSRFEPRMGAGNSSAALGDLAGARAAFEAATRLAPGNGDAWNNLASVLHGLHEDALAAGAIARALEIGGANRATYEKTAGEIHAGRQDP